jgi:hypothetical protein
VRNHSLGAAIKFGRNAFIEWSNLSYAHDEGSLEFSFDANSMTGRGLTRYRVEQRVRSGKQCTYATQSTGVGPVRPRKKLPKVFAIRNRLFGTVFSECGRDGPFVFRI